jgi:B-box zinc finger
VRHNVLFLYLQVVSRGNDTPYCKKHPAEQGKYYCRKCEHIVCTLCVVNDHGDHDVAEVTSVLRQQQTDVNNLRNVVQTRNNELKNRIAEIKALRQVSVVPALLSSTML